MTVTFEPRPPKEALAYFRDKAVGEPPAFHWQDVYGEEHVRNFVVAKMMQADLLVDTRQLLDQAIAAGWSKERAARELSTLLQSKGWWGKQSVVDPLTGQPQLAQLGSPRRVNTIVGVNMGQANMAGRWERLAKSAGTRNLVYHHTPQPRPRPDHQSWDGITLPFEHPFWLKHMPKNGWRCKCNVSSVRKAAGGVTSEDELQRRGVYRTKTWTNKRTGEVRDIPVGIDPGFDYNPGIERGGFVADQLKQRAVALAGLGLRKGADLFEGLAAAESRDPAVIAEHVASPAFVRFVETWAAKGRELRAAGLSASERRPLLPNTPWTPVAAADDDLARQLNVEKGSPLLLSPWTVGHGSSANMTATDWALAQQLVRDGALQMEPGGREAILMGAVGDKVYELVVKRSGEDQVFVKTFYAWSKSDVRKMVRKRARHPILRAAKGDLRF